MTKHIHAELMMQYAQDAMETDKPWERWEARLKYSEAHGYFLHDHPKWKDCMEYRRKPSTIRIGRYDVPEPVRKPLERGTKYYVPSLPLEYIEGVWVGCTRDTHRMVNGMIFLNKASAKLCSEALRRLLRKPQ